MPAEQLFELGDDIQIVKALMTRIAPGRQSQRLREQEATTLGGVTNTPTHAGKQGNQGRLKRIRKKNSQVEPAVPPFTHLCNQVSERTRCAVENQKIINKIGAFEDSLRKRT